MIIKTIDKGRYNTVVDQYVVDQATDVQNLPTNSPMGSIAFCIATSTFYMLNSSGTWTQI